jgi:hypothetical protein
MARMVNQCIFCRGWESATLVLRPLGGQALSDAISCFGSPEKLSSHHICRTCQRHPEKRLVRARTAYLMLSNAALMHAGGCVGCTASSCCPLIILHRPARHKCARAPRQHGPHPVGYLYGRQQGEGNRAGGVVTRNTLSKGTSNAARSKRLASRSRR